MVRSWLVGLVSVVLLALSATQVRAETLRIGGIYPAGDPDVAGIRSIAVARFSGPEGESLGNELEAQLSSVTINNEQYFTVLGQAGARADATLSGSVSTKVEVNEVFEKRKVCIYQDHRARCLREEYRNVRCERKNVVITLSIRMVRTAGGRLVYSKSKTDNRNAIQCPDDSYADGQEESIQGIIKVAASEARFDLAPSWREERVRVSEETDGMDKPTAKAFKEAIKATKKNEDTACTQFTALRSALPDHRALTFNLALCADKYNRYAEAAALYRQALPLFPNKDLVTAGLQRIAERQRAADELNRRRAPVPAPVRPARRRN